MNSHNLKSNSVESTSPFRIAAPKSQAPGGGKPPEKLTAIQAAQGERALPRTVLPTSRKGKAPAMAEGQKAVESAAVAESLPPQPRKSQVIPPAGKVILPTQRKSVNPVVSEPVALVEEACAEEQKSLAWQPRPIGKDRKKMVENVLRQATEEDPDSPLPAPKRTMREVAMQAVDPFETNRTDGVDAPIIGFGQMIAAKPFSQPVAPKASAAAAAPVVKKAAEPAVKAASPFKIAAPAKKAAVAVETPVQKKSAPAAKSAKAAEAEVKAPVIALPNKKRQFAGQAEFNDIRAIGHALLGHEEKPQTGESLAEMAKKPTEEARFADKKLHFSCPCCYHHIALTKKLAGQKSRCPQCDSAIRAPHPKRRLGAYSYERDIESLLHPDHFLTGNSFRPTVLGVPIPSGQQALMGCAAAMLLAGGSATFKWSKVQQETAVEATAKVVDARPAKSPEELRALAESHVAQFLKAEGWQQKIALVRDATRVAPLMEAHYTRNGGAAAVEPKRIRATSLGYYASQNLKERVCVVNAELPDGDTRSFRVEFNGDKPVLEWEASVAYNPRSWEEIVADDKNPEPQILRVAASLDTYFNHQFADDGQYLSVYLVDPITRTPLGNGYIHRRSPDAIRLREFLANARKRTPEQVTLRVRPVTLGKDRRMVEITEFVKGGFREPEPAAAHLAMNAQDDRDEGEQEVK